ncbi:MAG: ABC transporter ATP-binding protein [Clostridia bacterium]|nr:ABC transporter ATP-binding protein [Clostridia bacterium]
MICVKNLRFAYGAQPVLKGISFEVPSGGLTALLGCNGAGKTTLFRCLLGLEKHYEGSICLEGKSLNSYTPARLAQKIAYIPQSSYPAFQYTVMDMVLMGTTHRLGMFASPGGQESERAEEALKLLQIDHLAQRSYARLSGGEKQMVLIARALAQQARILLMDEPCASLDFGNQHRVMQTARTLGRQGYTVIMSSHSPQQVLTYGDRLLALSDGVLIKTGDPRRVLDAQLIKALYGFSANIINTSQGSVIVPEGGEWSSQ